MKDDVIERMAEAYEVYLTCKGKGKVIDAMRYALRAVDDTHRLVPVEPTNGMCVNASVQYDMAPAEHWELMLEAAPDYTEG